MQIFECLLFQGHELAMYILYHLHSVIVSDTKEQCNSSATGIYEKFLLGVVSIFQASLSMLLSFVLENKTFFTISSRQSSCATSYLPQTNHLADFLMKLHFCRILP